MKRLIGFISVFLTLNGSAGAQSQYELNAQESKAAAQTHGTVKKVIAKLEATNKNNKEFAHLLANSQAKWDKFVEAHLNSVFPMAKEDDYDGLYGSAYPMCRQSYKAGLNNDRFKELNNWLKLTGPGDHQKILKEYQKADQDLNTTYQKVMHSQAKDIPYFTTKMIESEKAWISFRDADANAYASLTKKQDDRIQQLIRLTQERTKQLSQWITGIKEGDVCVGSYPVK
jgi:uncharacterized protein YecT (DUF1311 family)